MMAGSFRLSSFAAACQSCMQYYLISAATLPVFKSQLASVETVQGKKIEFDCVVEATPQPEIAW